MAAVDADKQKEKAPTRVAFGVPCYWVSVSWEAEELVDEGCCSDFGCIAISDFEFLQKHSEVAVELNRFPITWSYILDWVIKDPDTVEGMKREASRWTCEVAVEMSKLIREALEIKKKELEEAKMKT